MESVGCEFTKYWMPVNWVFSLIYEMRARSQIVSDTLVNGFCQEVRTYRNNLQTLCNYDWVGDASSMVSSVPFAGPDPASVPTGCWLGCARLLPDMPRFSAALGTWRCEDTRYVFKPCNEGG